MRRRAHAIRREEIEVSGTRIAGWVCRIGVASILWFGAGAGRAVPPVIPTATELDIPYSAANPPGPAFTAEEKRRQLVDGQRIRGEIVAACRAGRESYTIPPGDYRFDSAYRERKGDAFALEELHGDPDRPFRILGHGATLWFSLTDQPAPHHHQMVKIFDCSHVTLEGVTVDSDPRGCMDATVTAFDFEGNRIQVTPVAGTRLIASPPSRENRFIPYKANGRHIAARDHRWINCHFMARPGTNNLLGGDGTMSACMHGSTFDGLVVQRTTDDCFNSHGHYRHAAGVTDCSITFREELPPELAPGHVAEAYETRTDASLGRLTVERVAGRTVTFREPVGERFATAAVMFPAFQNAGWVIRNGIFSDCYQRVRLMCGPGTFENNRVERIGGGLTVENGRAVDIEGGLPDGIVIRNNVFIDSGISPPMNAISVVGRGVELRNVEVSGNLICGSGSEAVEANRTDGFIIRHNIVIDPARGQSLLPQRTAGGGPPAAVALTRARKAVVAGNVVVDGPAECGLIRESACAGISQEDNRSTMGRQRNLERVVRHLTGSHESSAAEIIAKVRSELGVDRGPEQR